MREGENHVVSDDKEIIFRLMDIGEWNGGRANSFGKFKTEKRWKIVGNSRTTTKLHSGNTLILSKSAVDQRKTAMRLLFEILEEACSIFTVANLVVLRNTHISREDPEGRVQYEVWAGCLV